MGQKEISMEEILNWLLDMPASHRQAVIKSAKKMARTAHIDVATTLLFIYSNRRDVRTRSLSAR